MFEQLSAEPLLFTAVATLLGAIIGSFLNVVIYRLPVMMEKQWQASCDELHAASAQTTQITTSTEEAPFNLAVPGSRCPSCGHSIKAWQNIPVISYLFLRGKCGHCKTAIAIRYPIIEAISAAMSGYIAWHFGFGWEAAAALLLTWSLIPLTVIDLDHQLLPDAITLPFVWIGLGLSLFGVFADQHSAILGAIVGYLSLWSVYWGFKLLTGKEGMGYGDFKLLAMLGAWLGWQALPVIILMSSLVGAIVGISLMLFKGRHRDIPIPFGPYLAIAGWITLLWGQDISNAYLKMSGLS